VAHQLIELFFVQGLEQVMAAQNLVMDTVEHHGVDPCDSEKGDRGQTRLRDRPLASATTQESKTNQVSGRTTDFMDDPDRKGDAVAEQEPGQAWGL
jgi:hypothetical protein